MLLSSFIPLPAHELPRLSNYIKKMLGKWIRITLLWMLKRNRSIDLPL
jgi:hypothetical protein